MRDRWLGDDRPRYHTPPPLASRPPGIHSATDNKTTGHQGGYIRWPIVSPFTPTGVRPALRAAPHRLGAAPSRGLLRRYRRLPARLPAARIVESGCSEERQQDQNRSRCHLNSPPLTVGVASFRFGNRLCESARLPASLAATRVVESRRREERQKDCDRDSRHCSPHLDLGLLSSARRLRAPRRRCARAAVVPFACFEGMLSAVYLIAATYDIAKCEGIAGASGRGSRQSLTVNHRPLGRTLPFQTLDYVVID